MRNVAFLAAALIAATTSAAHQGVENPVVMERMQGMALIAKNMKIIGGMAKGKVDFDADAVRKALVVISEQASQTPVLFASREEDPWSEALPTIWDQFDDFASKSSDLEVTAASLAASVAAPEDLGPALQQLGQNCRACHARYRE